jgi:hypothetical protein
MDQYMRNTRFREANIHASIDAKLGHVLPVSCSSEPLLGNKLPPVFFSAKTLDLFFIFSG